jgi:hypothetical protein
MQKVIQIGENLYHTSCAPDGATGVIVSDFEQDEECSNCKSLLADEPDLEGEGEEKDPEQAP